ncbi:protein-lysine N-methyltransferase EEF2KMT isoform X2 [Spea bombifrons]|uniref:protein-lysine N-methyltransferase EEF2KMT isoform X2 n=1 Tax=Spea bombifrons TaxID=233779 RepID=UPI00234B424E|nr:protein-lysine N-methyltransferase EEF2KMT isoform X2 [Spea bombifrons]
MDELILCDIFQRSFFCGRRLINFPWRTVLHPLCQQHPPSVMYRRLFLLELIKKHQSIGAEPLDELYNALADVLNSQENTLCYKSYFLPSGDNITLSEKIAIISEGTTGLVTWEAALTLAEWSMENIDVFKNRIILELGSGAGLTGLAVCKSCSPRKYVFSDHHPKVLKQLTENILINGFMLEEEQKSQVKDKTSVVTRNAVQLSVIELDWQSVTKEQLLHLQADVVIASDVVYDPEITVSLAKLLKEMFNCTVGKRTIDVFIASTVRNPETYKLFKKTLGELGMNFQVIPGPMKILFPCDRNYTAEILKIYLDDLNVNIKD